MLDDISVAPSRNRFQEDAWHQLATLSDSNLGSRELAQAAVSAGALDANVDGSISPADVLTVINAVNTLAAGGGTLDYYPDVNGDMMLSPVDALLVVNYLHEQAIFAGAEGEATSGLILAANAPAAPLSPGSIIQSRESSRGGELAPSASVATGASVDVDAWRSTGTAATPRVARQPVADHETRLESILDDLAGEIADAWNS